MSNLVGEWFYEILGPQKNPIAGLVTFTDVFMLIHINNNIPFIEQK